MPTLHHFGESWAILAAIITIGLLPAIVACVRQHPQTVPISLLTAIAIALPIWQQAWWASSIANRSTGALMAMALSGELLIYRALPWVGAACWCGALIWSSTAFKIDRSGLVETHSTADQDDPQSHDGLAAFRQSLALLCIAVSAGLVLAVAAGPNLQRYLVTASSIVRHGVEPSAFSPSVSGDDMKAWTIVRDACRASARGDYQRYLACFEQARR
jgi:hypothetical protein